MTEGDQSIPKTIALPDQGPMLQAVGRCIQIFSMLEFAMTMCFASMMGTTDRKRSIAALNAIRRFEEKQKVVDAVADISLNDAQLAQWRNLTSRITRRTAMRNRVAHWTVSYWPGISSAKDAEKVGIALVPPMWSRQHMDVMWNEGRNTDTRPITLTQLVEFHSKTNELVIECFQFAEAITPVDSGDENAPFVQEAAGQEPTSADGP